MTAVAPTKKPKVKKAHRVWVWTLVVLATVILLLSSLTVFVRRQALNSQQWANASAALLRDQQIRDAMATYLTNELFANIDLEAELKARFPGQSQALAGPAAALVQGAAPRVASDLLGRPRVQEAWKEANLRAHQQFMSIINGHQSGPVQTQNGQVVLDLHPLVQQLADKLGVGGNVKPNAGTLVVFTSSKLKLAQDAVKAIKVLSVFLLILVLVLYAAAVWLARGWRREALRATGWGVVIVGVLLLVVRKYAGNAVVDSLVGNKGDRVAGHHAWLIASSLLRDVAWAIVLYGAAIVLATWLAGPTRWATEIRRALAPRFRDSIGVVWGAVVLLFLLLLWWGPTHAMHTWWGILILAGFVALGVELLRRQTLNEFPATGGAPAPPSPDA